MSNGLTVTDLPEMLRNLKLATDFYWRNAQEKPPQKMSVF
jgi:hypothetical protein